MNRPPVMILLGFFSTAIVGAASATVNADDVPRMNVQYPSDALNTDAGARALYRHLVSAAENVCPQPASGSPFVNAAEQECRDKALDRAVREINNPRLAEIYAASVPEGSLPTARAEDDANAPNERHERGTRDGSHRAGARGGHRRGQRRTGCRKA